MNDWTRWAHRVQVDPRIRKCVNIFFEARRRWFRWGIALGVINGLELTDMPLRGQEHHIEHWWKTRNEEMHLSLWLVHLSVHGPPSSWEWHLSVAPCREVPTLRSNHICPARIRKLNMSEKSVSWVLTHGRRRAGAGGQWRGYSYHHIKRFSEGLKSEKDEKKPLKRTDSLMDL